MNVNGPAPSNVTTLTASRTLGQLRAERGLSQRQLANALGIRQPSVSRQEARSDLAHIHVSSLRAAVAAMGGTLDVIARFPEGSVKIIDCVDGDLPY